MKELVYLIKVGSEARADFCERLALDTAPSHVRIATLAPLSNYGMKPGVDATILRVLRDGMVLGVEDRLDIPRSFIPWTNVAYVGDGTMLFEQQYAVARAQQTAAQEGAQPARRREKRVSD